MKGFPVNDGVIENVKQLVSFRSVYNAQMLNWILSPFSVLLYMYSQIYSFTESSQPFTYTMYISRVLKDLYVLLECTFVFYSLIRRRIKSKSNI